MRTAIVLAAGESRRMGTMKPLLPFGSGSVIEQVVRSLQASPIDAVQVVVGHRGAEIAAHLGRGSEAVVNNAPEGRRRVAGGQRSAAPGTGSMDNPRPGGAAEGSLEGMVETHRTHHQKAPEVHIVENPNYVQGMLSSVQAGVAAADPATTLFLIALADQPSIPPELIAYLIEVFDDRRPGMLIPTFDGRRGHPLLIDARYRDEIAALNPEVGLRELLQRHPDQLLLHPVSVEAVIRDLDTREEYERERQRWEQEQALRE